MVGRTEGRCLLEFLYRHWIDYVSPETGRVSEDAPKYVVQRRTAEHLVRELLTFEDQGVPVAVSVNDGDDTYPLDRIELREGFVLLHGVLRKGVADPWQGRNEWWKQREQAELAAARGRFGPDELGVMEQRRAGGPYRRQADALAMAVRWKVAVDRFDSERHLPPETYALRSISDLADTLDLRDFAETAVAALPEAVAIKVRAYLDAGDMAYRDWTAAALGAPLVQDSEEQERLVADPTSRAWWWFRRPVDGPIAESVWIGMAGGIEFAEEVDWYGEAWLFNWILGEVAAESEDPELVAELNRIVGEDIRWVSLPELTESQRREFLRVIRAGLTERADRKLPLNVPRDSAELSRLDELMALASRYWPE